MLVCACVRGFVKFLSVILLFTAIFLFAFILLRWSGVELIDKFFLSDIVKALFAVVTLFVANLQISRHLEQSAVESILKLRDVFNEKAMLEVQEYLCKGETGLDGGIKTILILNLLGYIEIGSIMLQRGIMTREQFRNQFKYTLGSVISNQWYIEHIIENSGSYEDLLFSIRLEFPDFCMLECTMHNIFNK